MSWLKNHSPEGLIPGNKVCGHVFGGRYKSIVVEPGECYGAILDCAHLDPVRAGLIVELIHRETTVRLDWISQELGMGDRSPCCRTIARVRGQLKKNKQWRLIQENMSISMTNPFIA